jgi:hypothetical protein
LWILGFEIIMDNASAIRPPLVVASSVMSSDMVIPPVRTHGQAIVTFKAYEDDIIAILKSNLEVRNISNITEAHIHFGNNGENGPVLATLYNRSYGVRSGVVAGAIPSLDIRSDNLTGPLSGKHIEDLMKMIDQQEAYLDIHTNQNPKGELRGQLLSAGSHYRS